MKFIKRRMTKFINYVSPGYIGVPSRYYYKLLCGTPYHTSLYTNTFLWAPTSFPIIVHYNSRLLSCVVFLVFREIVTVIDNQDLFQGRNRGIIGNDFLKRPRRTRLCKLQKWFELIAGSVNVRQSAIDIVPPRRLFTRS